MEIRKPPTFLGANAIWFTQSVGLSTRVRTAALTSLSTSSTQAVVVLGDEELALQQVSVLVSQIQVKCQHHH